jgi:hypothetical protein
MSLSAFSDKSRRPAEAELFATLGPSAEAWRELVAHVGRTYPPMSEEWNFASVKFGWSMRVKSSDRILLYLIPQAGAFLAGIVLGPKAVSAAQHAGLPKVVIEAIASAPRHAEGTGLRLPVTDETFVPAIVKLLALKLG